MDDILVCIDFEDDTGSWLLSEPYVFYRKPWLDCKIRGLNSVAYTCDKLTAQITVFEGTDPYVQTSYYAWLHERRCLS
jgi:hypothetical protein